MTFKHHIDPDPYYKVVDASAKLETSLLEQIPYLVLAFLVLSITSQSSTKFHEDNVVGALIIICHYPVLDNSIIILAFVFIIIIRNA